MEGKEENTPMPIGGCMEGSVPSGRDYSFHSKVHGMYSRLDYIMVEHRLLELVVKSSIKIMIISDHAPVMVKLKLTGVQNKTSTWRLNEEPI